MKQWVQGSYWSFSLIFFLKSALFFCFVQNSFLGPLHTWRENTTAKSFEVYVLVPENRLLELESLVPFQT